ncbi:hypothetical protein [Pseudomonas palleroniana]|uniref:Uncharacterized protein n=1 Tax=Pseudomonas palleroniana TaxID=191390 RepID=A0A109FQZ9_9PSED|nr:hypothetical protein [Pseudomonas palleroniana]KWU52865.1 hypothetical protein AWV77_00920 [Pseudomonas palleroniana]
MGLNVGVSLWVAPSDVHVPALRDKKPQGQTFAQKAGVEPLPAKAHQSLPPTDDHLTQETGSLTIQRLLQSSVKTPESGVLELYSLGLRAGKHLSYVPQLFELGTHAERGVAATDNERAFYQAAGAVPLQRPLPSVEEHNALEQTVMHLAVEDLADAGHELPGATSALAYLIRKWPERHVQVLPRGKGIEVMIRDYHLGPEEQRALVQDLTHQALRPQSIWINGQPAWQAPALSRYSTGDSNGH